MALSQGTRLGPYEIVALVGAGGMGEVYRARDPRLGRHVAIKILPAAFSADADRLWRFEREARAVASLNHPAICTIHDIGEHDGHRYLVMELLEGQTLERKLQAGPLPVAQLLDFGVQIADALDAAHGANVVHRDLKPANIFVTARGEAKLLDFGLAKVIDEGASPETTAQTSLGAGATFASPRGETSVGTLLGTAAYMSPEQARGDAADAQSDLFSFGAVLYEMATGRAPFTGKTMATLFDGILNRDPIPIAELNAAVLPELINIIGRALEKERDLRYRTASDMRADLKRLRRDASPRRFVDDGEGPRTASGAVRGSDVSRGSGVGSGSGVASGSGVVPGSGAVRGSDVARSSSVDQPASPVPQPLSDSAIVSGVIKRHRSGAIAAAIVALIVTGGLAYVLWPSGTNQAPRPLTSLDNLQVSQLTTSGTAGRPAMSPDGKYIVYVQPEADGTTSLWLRQTSATNSVKIMASEPGRLPQGATVGPDATFIDVLTSGPAIWRIPFLGGSPKLILSNVSTPVAWSPDGKHMAVIQPHPSGHGSNLVVTDPDGQNPRVVATRAAPQAFVTLSLPGVGFIGPVWSPDGERIATLQRFGEDVREIGISVFPVAGGEPVVMKVLGDAPQGLGWLDDSTLVFGQALEIGTPSQLWRVTVPDGQRSRLTNDVNRYSDLSVSSDLNNIATSRPDMRVSVWLGDGKGKAGKDVVMPAPYLSAALQFATLAWDGTQLLFTHTLNGRFEIFRLNVERPDAPEPVTAGREVSVAPDGTIAFRAVAGEAGLWTVDRNGRGPRQLATASVNYPLITPDGKHIVYTSPTDGGQKVFSIPVAGDAPAALVYKDPIGITSFSDVSPDGKSIAFVIDRKWHVCDFPVCTTPKPLAPAQGSRPRWTPDGRGIAYVDGNSGTNVWVQPIDGSAAAQLTQFTDGRTLGNFAWSRDGQRLAVSRATFTTDIVLFRGLQAK